MSTGPEDLLGGVLSVSRDGEPVLSAVGEQTLVVDTESGDVAALGDSTGVRNCQADRGGGVLDDEEVLESSGYAILSGVRDEAVGATTTDCRRYVR